MFRFVQTTNEKIKKYVPDKGQYKTDDPGEGSSLVVHAGHW